jgi:hypothetical protein
VNELAWTWLAAPYVATGLALAAVGVVAGLIRGDRVTRLGVIGSVMTALPWATCSALAACTDSPATATRLLRLGNGPVALVGPNLLLVLLAVSGQLERHRWIARGAIVVGTVLLGVCWATDWVVPGVHRLPSGILYPSAGPLTDLHFAELGIWLAIGLVIARRSTPMGSEGKLLVRGLVAVLALGAVGGSDLLLVHGIAGVYPVAWAAALCACGITLYLELRTDLLRPLGWDRAGAIELVGFGVFSVLAAGLAYALAGTAPVVLAAAATAAWLAALGATLAVARRTRPAQVADERALDTFAATVMEADASDGGARIAARLAALWARIGVTVRAVWRMDEGALVQIGADARWELEPAVEAWLVAHAAPLVASDLATMRLGELRPALEALDAPLVVPLLERGALVGLVEADLTRSLREGERSLVAESAKIAARALTYLSLARSFAREAETAREVEVAEALRISAAGSRADELGSWVLAAEYRSAASRARAAWSSALLPDGRLALLVTEAESPGVAPALAMALITGAFVAAAQSSSSLDELVRSVRSVIDGARRRSALGAQVQLTLLLAVLADDDPDPQDSISSGSPGAATLEWLSAGHAGFAVLDADGAPRLLPGGGSPLGTTAEPSLSHGRASLAAGDLAVIASSTLRGPDDAFLASLRSAATAPSLPIALVDAATRAQPASDLLAVAVRRRR